MQITACTKLILLSFIFFLVVYLNKTSLKFHTFIDEKPL